ncbi:MAG: UDP-2,3-diacylglucosamine diphosphatase [Chitinophagaceae bacterium]|nr:UDP-2,3-diacylglucosamine diphosphatase [Chitinophagaceae bacterium]
MTLQPDKKIYFLSDFHLGAPNAAVSLQREKTIVQLLDEIKSEAQEIFLVGDMFDFWFEYKTVVPKGFVRLLGKLAELSDSGTKLHFFVGNHDMWIRDYFQKELNMQVYFEPTHFEFNEKKFLIGHGDGQGPGDHKYKFLKKIFRNPICQWMFGIIPPSIGMGLANYFSHKSRQADKGYEEKFLGEDKEWLITYCREVLEKESIDYFIFGHRHLAIDFALNSNSRYINLGEWINFNSYAVFDGDTTTLAYYKK